jgi:hypothetical protein
MRSSTFSSLAVLGTSLLVKDALAGPMRQRDYVMENVMVTEVRTVTQGADGSLNTATNGVPVGTLTISGSVVIESATTVAASSSTQDSTPDPSVAAKAAGPVPAQPSKSGTAPAPSSSPSSGKSGNKRGLSYNDVSLLGQFTSLSNAKTSWAYNWGATPGKQFYYSRKYLLTY